MKGWVIICVLQNQVLAIQNEDGTLKVYRDIKAVEKFTKKSSLCHASIVTAINIETGELWT